MAPGPNGLILALKEIEGVIERRLARGETRLHTIDCHDIVCHSSDAVLSGGIRRSACIALFSLGDTEMMNCKTGNWGVENPQRARANNSVMLLRGAVTKEQFAEIIKSTRQFGEPGFYWVSDLDITTNPCGEVASIAKTRETKESGWWFCVSGDTKLITKNGLEKIENVVGETIDIWNGKEWSKATPFVTGQNRELYRVTLSDGSFLDCTSNHKWLIKNNNMKDFKEVETKDLLSLSTKRLPIYTPRPNVSGCDGVEEEFAREYGFFLGDGWIQNNLVYARLYGKKMKLNLRGKRGGELSKLNECNINFIDLDLDFAKELKNGNLPKSVFSWSENSILNFISGWLDADGSKTINGCRLYGEEAYIRDCQLLLTKVGINSSVNLMAQKGDLTNFGTRNQDIWYLQISDASKLSPERFDVSNGKEPAKKGKNQIIKSVIKLDGLHTTYCLEEQKLHQCLFNNVITKQCNLSTINMKKVKSREQYLKAARVASILGTIQASYTTFPYLRKCN